MNEFEILRKLLMTDRSVRRFDASKTIGEDVLKNLVELTRYCASGRNLQPLKYRLVVTPEECEKIYPLLKWAGYLTDWDGPDKNERPVAYLVQCLDTNISDSLLCDDGLHIQAITLGACSLGIGACVIKSFNVINVAQSLGIEEHLKPIYIIALGYPVEKVVVEDMIKDTPEAVKYYRSEDGIHHVPKRMLSGLIIKP